MKFKKLPYTGYKGGGCVPYLIANLTNNLSPIKGVKITKESSFDEYDASKMFQKATNSKTYFKAILAEDRYVDNKGNVKVLRWINFVTFAKSATIQQANGLVNDNGLLVILLETATKNNNLHAIGLFFDPKSGKCIVIDPAKGKPTSRNIQEVFDIYRVMKVCPLFFNATGLVFYPKSETGFLFEMEKPKELKSTEKTNS